MLQVLLSTWRPQQAGCEAPREEVPLGVVSLPDHTGWAGGTPTTHELKTRIAAGLQDAAYASAGCLLHYQAPNGTWSTITSDGALQALLNNWLQFQACMLPAACKLFVTLPAGLSAMEPGMHPQSSLPSSPQGPGISPAGPGPASPSQHPASLYLPAAPGAATAAGPGTSHTPASTLARPMQPHGPMQAAAAAQAMQGAPAAPACAFKDSASTDPMALLTGPAGGPGLAERDGNAAVQTDAVCVAAGGALLKPDAVVAAGAGGLGSSRSSMPNTPMSLLSMRSQAPDRNMVWEAAGCAGQGLMELHGHGGPPGGEGEQGRRPSAGAGHAGSTRSPTPTATSPSHQGAPGAAALQAGGMQHAAAGHATRPLSRMAPHTAATTTTGGSTSGSLGHMHPAGAHLQQQQQQGVAHAANGVLAGPQLGLSSHQQTLALLQIQQQYSAAPPPATALGAAGPPSAAVGSSLPIGALLLQLGACKPQHTQHASVITTGGGMGLQQARPPSSQHSTQPNTPIGGSAGGGVTSQLPFGKPTTSGAEHISFLPRPSADLQHPQGYADAHGGGSAAGTPRRAGRRAATTGGGARPGVSLPLASMPSACTTASSLADDDADMALSDDAEGGSGKSRKRKGGARGGRSAGGATRGIIKSRESSTKFADGRKKDEQQHQASMVVMLEACTNMFGPLQQLVQVDDHKHIRCLACTPPTVVKTYSAYHTACIRKHFLRHHHDLLVSSGIDLTNFKEYKVRSGKLLRDSPPAALPDSGKWPQPAVHPLLGTGGGAADGASGGGASCSGTPRASGRRRTPTARALEGTSHSIELALGAAGTSTAALGVLAANLGVSTGGSMALPLTSGSMGGAGTPRSNLAVSFAGLRSVETAAPVQHVITHNPATDLMASHLASPFNIGSGGGAALARQVQSGGGVPPLSHGAAGAEGTAGPITWSGPPAHQSQMQPRASHMQLEQQLLQQLQQHGLRPVAWGPPGGLPSHGSGLRAANSQPQQQQLPQQAQPGMQQDAGPLSMMQWGGHQAPAAPVDHTTHMAKHAQQGVPMGLGGPTFARQQMQQAAAAYGGLGMQGSSGGAGTHAQYNSQHHHQQAGHFSHGPPPLQQQQQHSGGAAAGAAAAMQASHLLALHGASAAPQQGASMPRAVASGSSGSHGNAMMVMGAHAGSTGAAVDAHAGSGPMHAHFGAPGMHPAAAQGFHSSGTHPHGGPMALNLAVRQLGRTGSLQPSFSSGANSPNQSLFNSLDHQSMQEFFSGLHTQGGMGGGRESGNSGLGVAKLSGGSSADAPPLINPPMVAAPSLHGALPIHLLDNHGFGSMNYSGSPAGSPARQAMQPGGSPAHPHMHMGGAGHMGMAAGSGGGHMQHMGPAPGMMHGSGLYPGAHMGGMPGTAGGQTGAGAMGAGRPLGMGPSMAPQHAQHQPRMQPGDGPLASRLSGHMMHALHAPMPQLNQAVNLLQPPPLPALVALDMGAGPLGPADVGLPGAAAARISGMGAAHSPLGSTGSIGNGGNNGGAGDLDMEMDEAAFGFCSSQLLRYSYDQLLEVNAHKQEMEGQARVGAGAGPHLP